MDALKETRTQNLRSHIGTEPLAQTRRIAIFGVENYVGVGAALAIVEISRGAIYGRFSGEKLLHGIELPSLEERAREVVETFSTHIGFAGRQRVAAHRAGARHKHIPSRVDVAFNRRNKRLGSCHHRHRKG